ncbi:MAG: carbon-nitrogen family hydrolase [Clostridium sp.]|jgi:predicted amidohydrolase|nr:carbon-nitrogen family hydrolase [Clostridium sp.]
MKLALTQMNIIWEEKEENLRAAEQLAREAKEAGAEMILFPEMSFTGFSMDVEKIGEETLRVEGGFPVTETVEKMLEWSVKYSISICFGYVGRPNRSRDGQLGRNCLAVVGGGRILTVYEKIHPFTYGEEGKHYAGGSRLSSCMAGGLSFGFFICYDLRFPEVFQLASASCQAIAVIANWPRERAGHWEALLRARAIENQCYMVGVNRVGKGGGSVYAPGSMAFDPYGNRVKAERIGTAEPSALLLCAVQPGLAEQYRREFPLKMDRREELYEGLRRLGSRPFSF